MAPALKGYAAVATAFKAPTFNDLYLNYPPFYYSNPETVFDSSVGGEPLTFYAGEGQMIKGFDDAVLGMELGEQKRITIAPAEAYGEWNPALVIEINRSFVPENITAGQTLYSMTGAQAIVLEVGSENVTLDTNHFLAGKTLTFDIKVVNITKPA